MWGLRYRARPLPTIWIMEMAGVLLNGLGDIRWPDLGFGFGYLGLDFAPLWALVAFMFNYVPTIGSIIAAIPAVLLALVQLDVQSALWVALGYLVVTSPSVP